MDLGCPLAAANAESTHLRTMPSRGLLTAAAKGDVAAVRQALEKGADPTTTNRKGETLLHIACDSGALDMLLIDIPGVNIFAENISAVDSHGWMPIHCAACAGHLAVAQYLHKKDPNVISAVMTRNGQTPLHCAVSLLHTAFVEWLCPLLTAEQRNFVDLQGQTAVQLARKQKRARDQKMSQKQIIAILDGSAPAAIAPLAIAPLAIAPLVPPPLLPPPPAAPPSGAQAPRPVRQRTRSGMPLAKKLEDGTDIVVPIGDFGKGVLIVGDQNSGKTYALKKTVEHLAMAQSMRNIIIFDVKGDWPQILVPSAYTATDAETKSRADDFEARCALRVYTFGTQKGWKATLNDLPVDVSADAWSGKDKHNIVNQRLQNSAMDVLSSMGIIKTNIEGKPTLLTTIPSLTATPFGTVPEAKKQDLAKQLVQTCKVMCQKQHALGIALPDSYEKFADELERAHEEFVSPTNGRRSGVTLTDLTTEDLRAVAKKIRSQIQDDSFNALYEPKGKTDETIPRLYDDFYPLNAETLCGSSGPMRDGKEVKVSVIKLDLLSIAEKEIVVQTVLQRLEAYRRMTTEDSGPAGGRKEPKTAIFIDEAHEAMPKPKGPKQVSQGATGIVKQILRLGHASGFVVCLGTHRPQDIHASALEAIVGPVFIGAVDKSDKNLKEVKDCLLGLGKKSGGTKRKKDGSATNLDQRVIDLLRNVDERKHEFLYQQGSDDGGQRQQEPTRIAFERLCRFHEDAAPWQKHPIDADVEHPMVKYVHKMYDEWVRSHRS